MDRYCEAHGDDLSKSWGADNAPRLPQLQDIARLLAVSRQGVPTASQMTPDEIADKIESETDPYAAAMAEQFLTRADAIAHLNYIRSIVERELRKHAH
ncbi:hypothetical protein [Nereida sp. MMG025]|uniref:hypothetical protein n=1 Tax=Nereida sp. MMG025 TaxID=2909981 RepID=UPI001F24BE7A|nr:hypothetical protein [Nereida sp. MMG025]MCF6443138.1 hypothetical protein [Nereida sp. MMG025]